MNSNPDRARPELSDQFEFWLVPQLLMACWRHPFLLILGLIGGVGLGQFYLGLKLPVYQSMAQVLVLHKQPDAPLTAGTDRGNPNGMEDYLATHQGLIHSPVVVESAVRNFGLRNLTSLQGSDQPTGVIIGGLRVNRDNKDLTGGSSNILTLTYRGENPDDCAAILHGVLQAYQGFLADNYRNVSDETVKLIDAARTLLDQDLVQKEKSYRYFCAQAPVLLARTKESGYLHNERLINLEARRSELRCREVEVREKLDFLQKGLKEGRNRAELLALLPTTLAIATSATSAASKDSGNIKNTDGSEATLSALMALLIQEEALLRDFGCEHPRVNAIRKRIAVAADCLTRGAGVQIQGDGADIDALVRFQVLLLTQKLTEINVAQRTYANLYEQESQEARALMNYELENENRLMELKRTRELYEDTVKRLKEINIVRDFGGYEARVISPPEQGCWVSPNVSMIRFSSVILGLLSGLGFAYLAHRLDNRSHAKERTTNNFPISLAA
jgi:polysaccharide biosynthesis transport protein